MTHQVSHGFDVSPMPCALLVSSHSLTFHTCLFLRYSLCVRFFCEVDETTFVDVHVNWECVACKQTHKGS